ncbi:phosphotransferase [Paenarthrobacter sp. Z7-10]|uniref:phosphotransferase n=1 Tax=Paenarthrobacter sp. Z7-10 TaxID=2787635 RepID=UPI0022A96AAE|nr:phosphotransferase [Paenarthrobacter sp. Z7-10]MCZ2402769.1 phosphotransferase [Paenarthrobacter sp. Z7-10]
MFDYAQTAQRAPWSALPPLVRKTLTLHLGEDVLSVEPAGGGFTHGFAAILRGGSKCMFAKAAPETDDFLYGAYLLEGQVLKSLPAGLPMPGFRTADGVDAGGIRWQLLCFDAVQAHMPGRPWTEPELGAVHASLLAVEAGVGELPPQLKGQTLAEQLAGDPDLKRLFGDLASGAELPAFAPLVTPESAADLQMLVDLSASALRGQSVLHNDLRPDNILIREADSVALFCDWNFLTVGPRWADWVLVLAYAWQDGLDADAWLQCSELSRGADPQDIDAWLAILAAYFVFNGARAEVPSSPRLRAHGRHSARMLTGWLAQRRGWS